MPLVPGGESGRRASTRWTTFSVIEWSPQVMKILRPEISFSRKACLSSSVAWRSIARIAPCDSSGHSANETFAAAHISSQASDTVFGSPCPPKSGLAAMPGQPPSRNCA